MRTRLIRPAFWTDSRMADLPDAIRLTYVGLWCLADDAGYLHWDHREIAAELYRYRSVRHRERQMVDHLDRLVTDERITVLPCQKHAVIPSIPDHRIKGGGQLFTVQKEHQRRCSTSDSVGIRRTTSDSVSVSSSVSDSLSGSLSRAKKSGSKDPSVEKAELLRRLDNPATSAGVREAIGVRLRQIETAA